MTLEQAYDGIRDKLHTQVQGTCGLYSFHNAVQIMRQLNASLPIVPTPKKCENDCSETQGKSLRQYAKTQLKSGQGEILTEGEMTTLIGAWGYKSLSCSSNEESKISQFLTEQTNAGYPVLIAYLAEEVFYAPVETATPGTAGGHWAVVIGTGGSQAIVVEPNAPRALKTWTIKSLLDSNAKVDSMQIGRYWAKVEKSYFKMQKHPLPPAPNNKYDKDKWMTRGVVALPHDPAAPDPPALAPFVDKFENIQGKPGHQMQVKQTKVYDLGDARHANQKLNHVVIAVRPP